MLVHHVGFLTIPSSWVSATLPFSCRSLCSLFVLFHLFSFSKTWELLCGLILFHILNAFVIGLANNLVKPVFFLVWTLSHFCGWVCGQGMCLCGGYDCSGPSLGCLYPGSLLTPLPPLTSPRLMEIPPVSSFSFAPSSTWIRSYSELWLKYGPLYRKDLWGLFWVSWSFWALSSLVNIWLTLLLIHREL